MRKYLVWTVIGAASLGLAAVIGCEDRGRVIEHEAEVQMRNGEYQRDETTVRQRNGQIIEETIEERREIDY